MAILPVVDSNQKAVVVDEKFRCKDEKVSPTLMFEEAISLTVLLLVETARNCETRGAVSEHVTLQGTTGATNACASFPFDQS